jgi:ABC-type multidrug transport system fused ATPase/permease subunit
MFIVEETMRFREWTVDKDSVQSALLTAVDRAGGPVTVGACLVAGAVSAGLLVARARSFEALRPRRRFVLEQESRAFLAEYFATGEAAGSRASPTDEDDDDGGMGMNRLSSTLMDDAPADGQSAERRSDTYHRCVLKDLSNRCAAARLVGCSPDVVAGLEAAIVEQCQRRVNFEAAQLALDARAADAALKFAAHADVRLPHALRVELQALRRKQRVVGFRFVARLLRDLLSGSSSRAVAEVVGDEANASKALQPTLFRRWLPRMPALSPRGQLLTNWALLFGLQTVDSVVYCLGHLLDEPAVAFYITQAVADMSAGGGGLSAAAEASSRRLNALRAVREILSTFFPTIQNYLTLQVRRTVNAQVQLATFARLAATDQATLDLCPARKPLIKFMSRGTAAVRDAATDVPVALGQMAAGLLLAGASAYRRELPFFVIGVATSLCQYDHIRTAYAKFLGAGSNDDVGNFLQDYDSMALPPAATHQGLELLVTVSAERRRSEPQSTPALLSFVSSALWHSSLSTVSEQATTALLSAAEAYVGYCGDRLGREQRASRGLVARFVTSRGAAAERRLRVQYWAGELSAARYVAQLVQSESSQSHLDTNTAMTIDEVLDTEERGWFVAHQHRIPLLPLDDWDAESFVTLRQLGMEAVTAARAFVAQQQVRETEAHRDFCEDLTRPSRSVFVTILEDWVRYAKAILAYEALNRYPSLAANLDSSVSGLSPRRGDFRRVGSATAEFLDGPVRFIAVYEASVTRVFDGLKTLHHLQNSAAELASVTEGLRITIDVDPTLTAKEVLDRYGDQLKLSDGSRFTSRIEFRDVHFAYPTAPATPVLQGVSFTIPCGATVGIIGPTGGGKSTLFKLLERLYHPQPPGATGVEIMTQTRSSAGHSIFIDGIDIDRFAAQDLRSSIGYVPQHPVILSGT